jgi:hypothetical protein
MATPSGEKCPAHPGCQSAQPFPCKRVQSGQPVRECPCYRARRSSSGDSARRARIGDFFIPSTRNRAVVNKNSLAGNVCPSVEDESVYPARGNGMRPGGQESAQTRENIVDRGFGSGKLAVVLARAARENDLFGCGTLEKARAKECKR